MKNSRITCNRITPLHARVKTIVENFIRNLNKIPGIANMQKRNRKLALYTYLLLVEYHQTCLQKCHQVCC